MPGSERSLGRCDPAEQPRALGPGRGIVRGASLCRAGAGAGRPGPAGRRCPGREFETTATENGRGKRIASRDPGQA